MDAAVAAQSMPGEAEIAHAPTVVSVDGAAAASLALRASGRQVTWARWARADGSMAIKGAKEVEQGSAAVAELSRPGKKDAANAFIAVATEEAAAVGGKTDAAAEDGADIESCMFKNVGFLAQMQNRSCGLR